MKDVIIFGAGKIGLNIKRKFSESKQYRVRYFCDNNVQKQGESLDGIPIISFEDVNKMSDVIIALAASNEMLEDIVEQVRRSGLACQLMGVSYYLLENEYFLIEDALYKIAYEKPRLSYYEYHVTHHCNLKCKGCGHYSNICDTGYGDLIKYIEDINRLKELFWGVERVRLMGGEPLLNADLPEFIEVTRKAFPDADLRIVTNGLLIPSINEDVFRTMRENGASFDITQYLPTSKVKGKIEIRCLENDISYYLSPLVTQFFDSRNYEGDSCKEEHFQKCISKGCHFLMDGKLSVCGFPLLYEKYKNDLNYKMEADGEVIDIHSTQIDGFMINERLKNPIDMCRYCDNINLKWFAWEGHSTG